MIIHVTYWHVIITVGLVGFFYIATKAAIVNYITKRLDEVFNRQAEKFKEQLDKQNISFSVVKNNIEKIKNSIDNDVEEFIEDINRLVNKFENNHKSLDELMKIVKSNITRLDELSNRLDTLQEQIKIRDAIISKKNKKINKLEKLLKEKVDGV
ncbi:MAG TPA: hypothetical protein EYH54_05775 [Nautiliaceae bacterium]|nr:hypothetical protein [Nautiliaceae bacterium]